MKSLVVLPLLFAVCFSLEVTSDSIMSDPHAFSSLMHSLNPGEVAQTADDVKDLIDIGEVFRKNATDHRDAKLVIRDAAKDVRDVAQADLTTTLGQLEDGNEEVTRLEGALEAAKALIVERIAAQGAADQLEIDEKKEMDAEIIRVDGEKETLENVLSILQGFLPAENTEEEGTETPVLVKPEETVDEELGKALIGLTSNPRRKLLSMSRTTTLLSNPNFIAALASADPTAIERVIELVEKLIETGESERQKAITEHDDAVTAAAVAAQDVDDAKASQARIEEDLSAEQGFVRALESERDAKQSVVNDKQDLLDDAQEHLDTYQNILDDETTRIDGEKAILTDAEGKLRTLEEVIQTLE